MTIMDRKVPLYSNLIRFHNNIEVASNVSFITHDVTHCMLNKYAGGGGTNIHYQEVIGCIEVMDNVFIGANATILSNVRIGPNAIIAAGSVVTKDVPPDSVVGGVPAKRICSFDEYLVKRQAKLYPQQFSPSHQEINADMASFMWDNFLTQRDKV